MFSLRTRFLLEMNLFVEQSKQTNKQTENFQLKNLSTKEAHQATAQAIKLFSKIFFILLSLFGRQT